MTSAAVCEWCSVCTPSPFLPTFFSSSSPWFKTESPPTIKHFFLILIKFFFYPQQTNYVMRSLWPQSGLSPAAAHFQLTVSTTHAALTEHCLTCCVCAVGIGECLNINGSWIYYLADPTDCKLIYVRFSWKLIHLQNEPIWASRKCRCPWCWRTLSVQEEAGQTEVKPRAACQPPVGLTAIYPLSNELWAPFKYFQSSLKR